MLIEQIYSEFLKSSGISTDTRKLKGNEIYVALSGEQFDGNDFVAQAVSLGCRIAVAERQVSGVDKNKVIVVDDALETLQQLATHHRKTWGGPVLAITGSNGKTTTKEIAFSVLSRKYRVLATEGNLNNHIGVPLTLLRIKREEIAIIEMGANHQGEIARLCEIARPEKGLITNIGKAHLEGFGGIEGVRKGKGELFDFLAKTGGLAVADLSDPTLSDMIAERNLKVFSYGKGRGYDVSGRLTSDNEIIQGYFSAEGHDYHFSSTLFGAYNFRNLLAAAAVGMLFKVPPAAIVKGLESYESGNNRSQVMKGRTNTLIMDAYNANPTSMGKAIHEFELRKHSRKIAILGDMYELGEDESYEHEEILRQLADSTIQKVLLVGERFGAFAGKQAYPFQFFDTLGDCMKYLESHPPEHALIMLKGSRKNALENATKFLLDR